MRSAARRLPTNIAWLESLTPWPEHFGLERMHALLDELGRPERSFRSIHVVGTNGKTQTTKQIEYLLAAEGLRAGATISPHIGGWSERITVGGKEADLEQALECVRAPAERIDSTQFEVVIAAAFCEFAAAGVEVAAVEAGLGGRYDATNVLSSEIVVLTNVALEHTQWLGSTREAIAREKLAVVAPRATVVLGESEWEPLARENGCGTVVLAAQDDLARAAVACLLGRPLVASGSPPRVPGRFEWRGERELRDGAHNPAGIAWLIERLPPGRWIAVCSILAEKDVEEMLGLLATVTRTLIATSASTPRALPARELAARAESLFETVETVDDPAEALARAHALAGRDDRVLVTGSLYLLADLARKEEAEP